MNFVHRVRDPIQYLRVLLRQRVGQQLEQQLEPPDVVYILKTMAREILPVANLSSACPQLELFGDWVVHHELARSRGGQPAIAKIAEAFAAYDRDGRDNKWLEEQVNDAISFPNLRLEFIGACRRFDLPEDLFTSWGEWQRFALPLAFEVSGRPIRVGHTGGAAKQAKARIDASGLAPEDRPRTLTLLLAEGTEGPRAWWDVQTPTGRVIVQLLFGDFRPDDFPVPAGWHSPL